MASTLVTPLCTAVEDWGGEFKPQQTPGEPTTSLPVPHVVLPTDSEEFCGTQMLAVVFWWVLIAARPEFLFFKERWGGGEEAFDSLLLPSQSSGESSLLVWRASVHLLGQQAECSLGHSLSLWKSLLGGLIKAQISQAAAPCQESCRLRDCKRY